MYIICNLSERKRGVDEFVERSERAVKEREGQKTTYPSPNCAVVV